MSNIVPSIVNLQIRNQRNTVRITALENEQKKANVETNYNKLQQNTIISEISNLELKIVENSEKTIPKFPNTRLTDYEQSDLVKYLDSIQTGNENKTLIPCAHISNVNPFQGDYVGGCVSLLESRLYLYPSGNQVMDANWHKIDYNSDKIETYAHGSDSDIFGYNGGCLLPEEYKSYLVPTQLQINRGISHYIDHTLNGKLVGYNIPPHPPGEFGIYSPKENRVYFIPNTIAVESQICYIHNGVAQLASVIIEGSVDAVPERIINACYDPYHNRIWLVPEDISDTLYIYYIECNNDDTGNELDIIINKVEHNILDTNGEPKMRRLRLSFTSMVLDPKRNIIYFIPKHMKLNDMGVTTYNYSIWYIDLPTLEFSLIETPDWSDKSFTCAGVYSFIDDKIYFMPNSQTINTPIVFIDCDTKKLGYVPSRIEYAQQFGAVLAPNGDIWATSGVQYAFNDIWTVLKSPKKQYFDPEITVSPLCSN